MTPSLPSYAAIVQARRTQRQKTLAGLRLDLMDAAHRSEDPQQLRRALAVLRD